MDIKSEERGGQAGRDERENPGEGEGKHQAKRLGGLNLSNPSPLAWIGEARELFPRSVFEALQAHAVDRLGLTELLADPKTLDSLEPNGDLLRALIAFKGRASPAERSRSSRSSKTSSGAAASR